MKEAMNERHTYERERERERERANYKLFYV